MTTATPMACSRCGQPLGGTNQSFWMHYEGGNPFLCKRYCEACHRLEEEASALANAKEGDLLPVADPAKLAEFIRELNQSFPVCERCQSFPIGTCPETAGAYLSTDGKTRLCRACYAAEQAGSPGPAPTVVCEFHPPAHDTINHPQHYTAGGVECIEAIESAGYGEGFCLGNAMKYLWRWQAKGGVDDLKKARWYLDRKIQQCERMQGKTANASNQE